MEANINLNGPLLAFTRDIHPRRVALLVVGSAMIASCSPVHAADGCKVLLCLAAASWRSIPQCVPPVEEALRDLARGKPFPACNMAGPGNSASHAWASAPDHCPPQYTRRAEGDVSPSYSCDYDGAITVTINGSQFSRTWWSQGGGSVTEFSPEAKAQLGTWNTRFEDDHAAWLAAQPQGASPSQTGD